MRKVSATPLVESAQLRKTGRQRPTTHPWKIKLLKETGGPIPRSFVRSKNVWSCLPPDGSLSTCPNPSARAIAGPPHQFWFGKLRA